ncbi:MAG: hypothetical protein P1V20_07110 [Verrucomicrobiales bacterium]|nr:hypothetical protein [Verrucomicrobiales bacterium]
MLPRQGAKAFQAELFGFVLWWRKMDFDDDAKHVMKGHQQGRSFGERLFFLALTYGLTTVVGGFLAFFFQEKSRVNERQSAMFTSQKEEAMSLYREVTGLMGERSYLMLRIYFGSGDNPFPDDYEDRWDAYVDILHKWNSSRFTRRAMIEAYFGKPFWDLEREIHYQFRDVGKLLEKGKVEGQFPPTLLKEIDSGMDDVTTLIKKYNSDSLQAILSGEIGAFRTKSTPKADETESAEPATQLEIHEKTSKSG